MKRSILIFSTVLALISCSKEVEKQDLSANASSSLDLKVPENFDWKTTQEVEVEFKALPGAPALPKTLVVSMPDGRVLAKRSINLSEDLELKLTLPASLSQVHARIDQFETEVDIESGAASFDMSIANDQSDLD